MTDSHSVPEDREKRVQHFVDLANETPGMADALRAGSIDAMVDFFELAPGAHITEVTVKESAPQELVS